MHPLRRRQLAAAEAAEAARVAEEAQAQPVKKEKKKPFSKKKAPKTES